MAIKTMISLYRKQYAHMYSPIALTSTINYQGKCLSTWQGMKEGKQKLVKASMLGWTYPISTFAGESIWPLLASFFTFFSYPGGGKGKQRDIAQWPFVGKKDLICSSAVAVIGPPAILLPINHVHTLKQPYNSTQRTVMELWKKMF